MASVATASADETFALGEALGQVLEPFDFIGLSGQLGAGKTQLSRGIAQGAGVPVEDVSSPTYAIIQSYAGRLTLHHLDLYRLQTQDDLYSVGYFDLLEQSAAMLVEWVDQVPGAAPDDALRIRIDVPSAEERVLTLEANGPRSTALLARLLEKRTRQG